MLYSFFRDVIDKSIGQSLYLELKLINFLKANTRFITDFYPI